MKTTVKLGVLLGLLALAINQASANLVINGDFEAGNTGFTSGYKYVPPDPANPNEMWPEGTYTVFDNVNAVHSLWTYGPAMDHTPGAGKNMLIVNGNHLSTVWQGTLSTPLTPGTYKLTAWVANIYPDSPSTLRFSVGGTQVGADFVLGSPGAWTQFSTTFTVPPISGVPSFLDLNTIASGNDFAVDDISLVAVPEPSTLFAGAMLLLPFGASMIRIMRRNRAS